MLTDEQKEALLRLARETILHALGGGPAPEPPDDEAFRQKAGAFVSLHKAGRLRGCIGTFSTDRPLVGVVQEMARSVLRDPRFVAQRVQLAEMQEIDIEISVIAPLERMKDPMAELEMGRHGICIESPYGSGCFLPQVADETGWSKAEFLSHCAAGKAGLDPDAWTRPDVKVFRFEAEVFGEK